MGPRALASRPALGTRQRRYIPHRIDGVGVQFQNRAANHVIGLWLLGQGYRDALSAQDTCLFGSDFSHRIAKKFLVVERDVGDDADAWFHYIGCIQSTAHPNFEHRELDSLARKMLESHGGDHLEKARVPGQLSFCNQTGRGLLYQVMPPSEIAIRDRAPIDSNALVDSHQVRRRVQSGVQAGCLENRG